MNSRIGNRAFTLIELLIVIAIIAILAAILFPVFAAAREKARQTTCASNEKQLGLAILQYAQDYDEFLPTIHDCGGTANGTCTAITNNTGQFAGIFNTGELEPVFWCDLVVPYVNSKGVFVCPSNPGNTKYYSFGYPTTRPYYTTYAYNTKLSSVPDYVNVVVGLNLSKVVTTSNTVTLVDSLLWFDPELNFYGDGLGVPWIAGANVASGSPFTPMTCYGCAAGIVSDNGVHSSDANFAFVDGHVKWMKQPSLLTFSGAPYDPTV